jgi:hypothetical protein
LDNIPARSMAQASREAFDRILPTLTERELFVCRHVANYISRTGFTNVTGGELAEWAELSILSVRPRLSGCYEKGYITRSVETRASRIRGEGRCHAYSLAVPIDAIDRAVRALGKEAR